MYFQPCFMSSAASAGETRFAIRGNLAQTAPVAMYHGPALADQIPSTIRVVAAVITHEGEVPHHAAALDRRAAGSVGVPRRARRGRRERRGGAEARGAGAAGRGVTVKGRIAQRLHQYQGYAVDLNLYEADLEPGASRGRCGSPSSAGSPRRSSISYPFPAADRPRPTCSSASSADNWSGALAPRRSRPPRSSPSVPRGGDRDSTGCSAVPKLEDHRARGGALDRGADSGVVRSPGDDPDPRRDRAAAQPPSGRTSCSSASRDRKGRPRACAGPAGGAHGPGGAGRPRRLSRGGGARRVLRLRAPARAGRGGGRRAARHRRPRPCPCASSRRCYGC